MDMINVRLLLNYLVKCLVGLKGKNVETTPLCYKVAPCVFPMRIFELKFDRISNTTFTQLHQSYSFNKCLLRINSKIVWSGCHTRSLPAPLEDQLLKSTGS